MGIKLVLFCKTIQVLRWRATIQPFFFFFWKTIHLVDRKDNIKLKKKKQNYHSYHPKNISWARSHSWKHHGDLINIQKTPRFSYKLCSERKTEVLPMLKAKAKIKFFFTNILAQKNVVKSSMEPVILDQLTGGKMSGVWSLSYSVSMNLFRF